MVRKALLLKIFDAAYMQRWNDKIRPVELTELDKQAHKMVVAYFLGKFEEANPGFEWIEIIEGGIFEFLQRIVVTDLKPPIFYKIKENRSKYEQLNQWVYNELESIISPINGEFCKKFKNYFSNVKETINNRILNAAHFYTTKWEFKIIEHSNPEDYEIDLIKEELQKKQDLYKDLDGINQLTTNKSYRNFIDLCGQLRFQSRWANLHRIPRTSVMGHMLYVAIISYLFSLQIGASKKRCINNYFTGLFHDLPEVLTRDIISPVKSSVEGLKEMIKEYEKEQMVKEVYDLIPEDWCLEMQMFTEDEFEDKFDSNLKEPVRDGSLVKACDDLAAFIEAYSAIQNGCASQKYWETMQILKNKYERKNIVGINFGEIYADFD